MIEFIETLSKLDSNFLTGLAFFIIVALGALSSCFPIVVVKNKYYIKDEDKHK